MCAGLGEKLYVPSIYYGQGAGMMPTATAVVADVLDAARNIERAREDRHILNAGLRLILEANALGNVKRLILIG